MLLLRKLCQNCFLNILISRFTAEHFVINRNVWWLDRIVLMTKTKETGINSFHFNLIRIFLFDSPGQSTEIRSPLSSRPIGIDCYFNHVNTPPYPFLETDKLVARGNHFIQIFLTALSADVIFFQSPKA
jgi:hypothetical protein